jgi:small subunit ribosomal protein S4
MFYAKQQLRLFHGEIKESAFRNFFRNHLSATTIRSKSFFSALESRLDMIFFRRRLLPTIFACRQFITHQGLEVNSKIELSPRALIRTGDRVAVSETAWESIYYELLLRIYYRR